MRGGSVLQRVAVRDGWARLLQREVVKVCVISIGADRWVSGGSGPEVGGECAGQFAEIFVRFRAVVCG